VVGAFGHNWDQIFRESEGLLTNLRKIVPGAEWVAIDAFPSSDGITHKSHSDGGVFVFIPKAAKNPINAMRYLNWTTRFENLNFLQIGPEGIVHKMADGLPVINPNAGDGWIQNSGLNIDLTPLANGLFLKTQEESIRALALTYPFPIEMVMQAYNVSSNNSTAFPIINTPRPLLAAGPVALTLQQQAEALLINAIMASPENFDSVWNAGITNWLNSGAQAVVDERRENFVSPF
jgi:putative aldouronate transport system substrate-binding protein